MAVVDFLHHENPPTWAGSRNLSAEGQRQTNHATQPVKVSDRGLPCHEFEPSTTKDPPCRAAMHVKSVES
ncbi:hypothetical protein TNCV_4345931 [Trichonephila clavipes]|nr:hypothetical protein TNCV_4345931 [Trichonephila clavipes]